MSCQHDTAASLRSANQRVTIPRLRVAAALRHASDHRTARELHEQIRREHPEDDLALSTVYRTLCSLRELGLASMVKSGTAETWEWVHAAAAHHHLVCRLCGGEQDLDAAHVDRLVEAVRAESGFEPHLDHFVVFGLCAACRTAEGETEKGELCSP